MSLRNVRQESLDQSGQAVCLSLGNYMTLFVRHMAPLAHDNLAEVVYVQLYIQGLTNALWTWVETTFRKHLGPQNMTRLNQMNLLEEVVSMATKGNLEIGEIADVVYATQLQSLAAVVNATSSNVSA